MWGCLLLRTLKWDQIIQNGGVSIAERSGHSELSMILQESVVKECLLRRAPL